MKQNKLNQVILLVFVCLSLVFTNSCKKDSTSSPNKLSAKIDGVVFTAGNVAVSTTSGTIAIAGVSGHKSIVLWLPTAVTVGTHSVISLDYYAQFTDTDNYPTGTTTTTGSIVITGYDAGSGHISGTFSFSAATDQSTVNINNGQFDVTK